MNLEVGGGGGGGIGCGCGCGCVRVLHSIMTDT